MQVPIGLSAQAHTLGSAEEANVTLHTGLLTELILFRYRTDLQPRRILREKQKQLVSHCVQVSGAIADMAASDPWKLVQLAFEYGFFFNGLAQVCAPHA